MIYFTSDHHFYHNNIIKLCNRPFSSIEEMHESYIEDWNKQVSKKDEVYHLGDFSFIKKKNDSLSLINNIVNRLNGHIHLIIGNHDVEKTWNANFKSVSNYKYISIEKQKIVLFHYPIVSWRSMSHGSWCLHGHCHGSYQSSGLSIDVGIDVWNKLLSFDDIKKIMKNREIAKIDHH